jgi:GT2 family glycosyltransferase
MSVNPKVAIVIVNWNKRDDVINLLNSLGKMEYKNYDAIVVDNASSDDSVEKIQEQFPDIELIVNKENLGGTGGFNTGITRVIGNNAYKYIWILDNDAEVTSDTLKELVSAMEEDSNIGIAGSRIMSPEERDLIVELGGFVNWNVGTWKPNLRYLDESQYRGDNVVDTDYAAACSAIVRTTALKEIGIMDERFFLHWDDIDFCLRISESGYKVVSVFSSRVYHSVEKGFNANILYYDYRNGLLAAAKHLSGLQKFITTVDILRQSMKAMIFFLLSGRASWAKLILKSLLDFMTGNFGKSAFAVTGNYNLGQNGINEPQKDRIKSARRILVFANGTYHEVKKCVELLKDIAPNAQVDLLVQGDRVNLFRDLPFSDKLIIDLAGSSVIEKINLLTRILRGKYSLGISTSQTHLHPYLFSLNVNVVYDRAKNSFFSCKLNIRKIWIPAISVVVGECFGILLSPIFYLRELSYRVK